MCKENKARIPTPTSSELRKLRKSLTIEDWKEDSSEEERSMQLFFTNFESGYLQEKPTPEARIKYFWQDVVH